MQILCIVIAYDSNLIISGSDDSSMKVWDLGKGNEIQTVTEHTGDINSLSLSVDGKLLASASDDCTIKLWRVSKLGIELFRTINGHNKGV